MSSTSTASYTLVTPGTLTCIAELGFAPFEYMDETTGEAKGFDIDRSAIRMPDGPLKQVGETSLEVSLHADVLASITVVVAAEQ